MTDYSLKISSFGGWIAGATHSFGRVESERPDSCHGGEHFNSPEARGKNICDEGHEIPKRIEWDVDDFWSEEDHKRWQASHYETEGPGRFRDRAKLIDVAIRRFRYEREPMWFEDSYPRPQPGDRLYLGFVPTESADIDEEFGRQMGTPPYGSLLAEIEVPGRKTVKRRPARKYTFQTIVTIDCSQCEENIVERSDEINVATKAQAREYARVHENHHRHDEGLPPLPPRR